MISLLYKDLSHPAFISGLRKLAECSNYGTYQTLYSVAKLISLLEAELKTMAEIRNELASRLNSKDNIVSAQEQREESDKFLAVEVEIDRPKLKLSEVFPARLSALEISVLLPILDEG